MKSRILKAFAVLSIMFGSWGFSSVEDVYEGDIWLNRSLKTAAWCDNYDDACRNKIYQNAFTPTMSIALMRNIVNPGVEEIEYLNIEYLDWVIAAITLSRSIKEGFFKDNKKYGVYDDIKRYEPA